MLRKTGSLHRWKSHTLHGSNYRGTVNSHIVRKSNWKIFESYLLKCGYSFPNTLQVIAQILATYNRYSYDISKDALQRFCNTLIKVHAISDHHSEVSWLLWICKELKLNLSPQVVWEIEGMSSSVCVLLILDLFHSGIVKTNVHAEYLRQFANTESLYSDSWLLSYEAGRRLWLKNKDCKHIEEDHHFSALLENDVSFYDRSRSCKPIFELKPTDTPIDIEALLDSDDSIEDRFEFEDLDEEYFDETESEEDDELTGDAEIDFSDELDPY